MTTFTAADLSRLSGVDLIFTDVDDTLTHRGRLSARTLDALARLAEAGVRVVPVTGGCAGWCDHLVRAWPVAAVIGESGAFRFRMRRDGGLERRFVRPLNALRADQQRLLAIAHQAIERVPAARLALDQDYRLVDVAVDHAQDIPPLPREQVRVLIDTFQAAGAHARASSIHVNAWFGEHDKATMARQVLEQDFAITTDRAARVLFIGDAPNDETMFGETALTFGVANIRPHLASMAHTPRWVCEAAYGDGFVEMADYVLAARAGARQLPAPRVPLAVDMPPC
ncbi:HAD family hydrolase [Castellaniella caeni]|uniref:HAD family hydrolase n=1 Tax=Castellaniella caeni TaxID=266123 RepID=UPI0009FE73F2|nr:HAD-IIB family hydrolase [Castellaniella caeni]